MLRRSVHHLLLQTTSIWSFLDGLESLYEASEQYLLLLRRSIGQRSYHQTCGYRVQPICGLSSKGASHGLGHGLVLGSKAQCGATYLPPAPVSSPALEPI